MAFHNNYLVGDQFPSARVCGIDLTPIQPLWVPPNVEFLIDDCEQDWLARDVDLVHFRFMVVILRDISGVLEHAYKYGPCPLSYVERHVALRHRPMTFANHNLWSL